MEILYFIIFIVIVLLVPVRDTIAGITHQQFDNELKEFQENRTIHDIEEIEGMIYSYITDKFCITVKYEDDHYKVRADTGKVTIPNWLAHSVIYDEISESLVFPVKYSSDVEKIKCPFFIAKDVIECIKMHDVRRMSI